MAVYMYIAKTIHNIGQSKYIWPTLPEALSFYIYVVLNIMHILYVKWRILWIIIMVRRV